MTAGSSDLRRIALSSMAGTTVEYYDFMLYATMTALVFDRLFFPSSDPSAAAVAAFGTLAAGYVARPLGGILFGHLGDRLGRKRTLITTMSLMGAASFLIGCLPTYETIGHAAPVLLVLLRVGQGIAVGGEWGGAILMVAEHAQPSARGRWNGVPQMGTAVGSLLSTLIVMSLSGLPHEALMSWGWRVPFLLSAALLVIGLHVRVGVSESPVFKQAQESAPNRSPIPLTAVLRRPGRLVLACAAGIGAFGLNALISTYMLSYARNIGYPTTVNLTAKLAGVVALLIAIPVFSALSDRLGRRTVMLGGAVASVLYAYPMFALVDSLSTPRLIAAVVIGQIIEGAMLGPLGAMLSEMFDTESRYTGVSLSYQGAALIGAGFTPLLASSLLVGGPRSMPLVLIVAGCGLVTMIALLLIGETKGRSLEQAGARSLLV
ncbi:MAG: MFS transporter [Mycobacterium sp.]